MLKSLSILSLGLSLSLSSYATEIASFAMDRGVVTLTQLPKRAWKTGELVCTSVQGRDILIAKITSPSPRGAVALAKRHLEIPLRTGMPVFVCPNRGTASTSVQIVGRPGAEVFSLGIGASAGTAYVLPYLHLQYALSANVALGAKGFYFSGTPESDGVLTCFGGLLDISYFFGREVYSGFFVEAGVGAFAIQSEIGGVVETATPFSLATAFGWQGKLFGPLSVLGAVGGQYVFRESLPNGSTIRWGGLIPQGTLGLAVLF